jgi:hypothetical protein
MKISKLSLIAIFSFLCLSPLAIAYTSNTTTTPAYSTDSMINTTDRNINSNSSNRGNINSNTNRNMHRNMDLNNPNTTKTLPNVNSSIRTGIPNNGNSNPSNSSY